MVRFWLLMISVFALSANADDLTFRQLLDLDPVPVLARTTQGTIRSIDLAERTGIISGFKYWFGPPDFWELEVKLYQSDAGSLELLQEGMKVEIDYGEKGVGRLAFRIRQLANDADTEF